MTKLEEKLIELCYELCLTEEILKPTYQIIKIYIKDLGFNNFVYIYISDNKIVQTINTPIKDLEELKKYEN